MIARSLAAGLVVLLALCGTAAMAVEEPPFTLVVQAGDFEIRDYPALVVAQTEAPGGRDAAAYAGFRTLAGYIFGANARRQSIAMTAPVVQAASGAGWTIRFGMPEGLALEALPRPDDPGIRLAVLAPSRLAVVRFSGLADPRDVEAQTARLIAFARARGLRVEGAPSLARYDPPWTPWFMRRNEVMIPVAR
jgi:hypothetical protein